MRLIRWERPVVAMMVGAVLVSVVAAAPATAAHRGSHERQRAFVGHLAPGRGPAGGGVTVTVTGRNFRHVRQVIFGHVRAHSLRVSNERELSVVAPPHRSGWVHVRVKTDTGWSRVRTADRFYYNPVRAEALAWSTPQLVDPEAGFVDAVSCPTVASCIAVDASGNSYTFDGSTWSAPASVIDGAGFSSLSCPTASFCAAGTFGGSVVTFDGNTWSTPEHITATMVSQISCATASFCVGVDTDGEAVRYDGTSWSAPQQISRSALLTAVSCPSSTYCLAAGADRSDSSGVSVTFDGASWSLPTTISSRIRSVSCTSPTFCVGVADAAARTWDGAAWSERAFLGLAGSLTSVSCTSTAFCIAVDDSGDAIRYDGSSWEPSRVMDSSVGPRAVSCVSRTFCVIVDASRNHAVNYDGNSWSAPVVVVNGSGEPGAVDCPTSSSCNAIDGYGSVLFFGQHGTTFCYGGTECNAYDTERENMRLARALDRIVEEVERIPPEQAAARDAIWTPDKENPTEKPKLWTPGSKEPV